MDVVVSIHNATTYTPQLTQVELVGAEWVATQELHTGQSIATQARAVGMLSCSSDDGQFALKIVLHYGWVAPGPDGADVALQVTGELLDGRPLVGARHEVVPAGTFPDTDTAQATDDGVPFVMLTVQ